MRACHAELINLRRFAKLCYSQYTYPSNGHIKTAEQRTIAQQFVIGTLAVDGWAVVPSSLYQM